MGPLCHRCFPPRQPHAIKVGEGILPFIAASVLLALVAGCGENGSAAAARPNVDKARRVRLVQVGAGSLPRTVVASGTLAAEDEVVLNTKVPGRLEQLNVDLGSTVHAGDSVAALDLTDFRLRAEQARTALAQARARLGVPSDGSADVIDPERTALVRQARAVLEQARRQRDRLATLHRDGLLSKAELDQADADFLVAEARLQEALEEVRSRQALVAERRAALHLVEQELADATLRAPFDGVVRARHLSVGAYLQVGAPVVSIVRIHPLRLRLSVPERDAVEVRKGQVVRVHQEGQGTPVEGRLVRLSPAVDEQTRTLLVEAELPNRDGALRPGAFVTADIIIDPEQRAVFVPAEALITFAGVTKVLGVADGRIAEKRVRVGRRVGNRVEVLEGLAAGDAVVAEPGTLTAGQAVEVE